MDSENYRIGNLIFYNNNDKIGKITTLVSDFVAGLDYCQIDYNTYKKHWLINMNPITLTKERIHETKFFSYRWKSWNKETISYMNNDDSKCAFKQDLKSFDLVCDYKKEIYYVSLGRIKVYIKYFHELQNLYFTLTGKELTHKKIN